MATSAANTKPRDSKVLRGLGILGLLGIGGAHLQYWLAMLRDIPTRYSIIGPLFEVTFIAAFVLALVMIVLPRALVAMAAGLFSFATLGGYILSLALPMGVFNYHDPGISYSGGVAIAAEVIGGLALLAWGGARLLGGRTAKTSSVPFGSTIADPPRSAKPAKPGKPGRAKAPVPFGATAEDVAGRSAPTQVNPKLTSAPSAPVVVGKPSKRVPSSVQDQIEQAQAAFQASTSPPF